MPTTLEINLMLEGRTGTSPAQLTVYRQDWWEDGFDIEAISEEHNQRPQYWLRLTGHNAPKKGTYRLDGDDDREDRLLIEFGLYNRDVQPIENGAFILESIEFNQRSLKGEFEFTWEHDDEKVEVQCWDLEVLSPSTHDHEP
ncbi:hypothetical protein ACLPJF_23005 [Pseudomonas vlassakiae]|jgi:hypothetical protein|uniref:hypothetical protein n=1 Tax=Pseudomonas TaxID=286 RepID=UPI000C17C21E|nr:MULTISPECIES: hypothetical protein [unclassified Pseudomonas]AXQ47621.1 hypothetical protein DZC31_09605 [Stenotrophomonas rhizophila]MBS3184292.1 hypothetical protein [Pseudomonas sp. PCH44]PIK76892.1 hypothetical protein CQW31_19635 [Pseudomonas sp. 382]